MDWTAGYVADIGYTFGYYTELNPARARLGLLSAGYDCPKFETACELGFGQGVSINIHAASGQTQWWGNDFNPVQAAYATKMAKASTANVTLCDDSFEEFLQRADLPEFDFIGMNGIWSWVSDRNRAVLVDFIKRKLKIGGLLYVSYNTMPGWGAFAPVRYLMTEYGEKMVADGCPMATKIDGALDFLGQLERTNPVYFKVNPQIKERIERLQNESRNYLAHEYFNRDWNPMHFSELYRQLISAKVDYACSANFVDQIDVLNLNEDQRKLLMAIPDRVFREDVRDFMVCQQFRKDYWMKGGQKLSDEERKHCLRAERVLLVKDIEELALKVSGPMGEISLDINTYRPVLDLLGLHRVIAIGEIEAALQGHKMDLNSIVQFLVFLAATGSLVSVLEGSAHERTVETARKLNEYITTKASEGTDLKFLASPITGGGVAVGRFHQLFLNSLYAGRSKPEQWAEDAWLILKARNERLIVEGKKLESESDNRMELCRRAEEFETHFLPTLKTLGVV